MIVYLLIAILSCLTFLVGAAIGVRINQIRNERNEER